SLDPPPGSSHPHAPFLPICCERLKDVAAGIKCPDECVHAFDAVSTGADPHLPRRHWQHGYGEGQAESAGCAARPRLAAMAEVLKVGGAEETVVDLTEDGAPLRGFAERKRATDLLSCYPAHLSCCRTRTKCEKTLGIV
uniref:Uncharacterized protein n=1 Tax=Aegilops tauschii subsp. strangulata TaxID=200361 RepID=A0A453C420_AEGTS